MTPEQKLDHDAYTACGYTDVWIWPSGEATSHDRWYEGHGNIGESETPLAPWSSTDDAIGHAERGKFNWSIRKVAVPVRVAKVAKDGDNWMNSTQGTHPTSPGIAIRNAIIDYAMRKAGG